MAWPRMPYNNSTRKDTIAWVAYNASLLSPVQDPTAICVLLPKELELNILTISDPCGNSWTASVNHSKVCVTEPKARSLPTFRRFKWWELQEYLEKQHAGKECNILLLGHDPKVRNLNFDLHKSSQRELPTGLPIDIRGVESLLDQIKDELKCHWVLSET